LRNEGAYEIILRADAQAGVEPFLETDVDEGLPESPAPQTLPA